MVVSLHSYVSVIVEPDGSTICVDDDDVRSCERRVSAVQTIQRITMRYLALTLLYAMHQKQCARRPPCRMLLVKWGTPTTSTTIADTAPTPTNSSSQATNIPNSSQDVDELETQQHVQQQDNQAPLQPEIVADNVLNAMFDYLVKQNEKGAVNKLGLARLVSTDIGRYNCRPVSIDRHVIIHAQKVRQSRDLSCRINVVVDSGLLIHMTDNKLFSDYVDYQWRLYWLLELNPKRSKAFRVYNKRTKRVEENLHINFLEDQSNVSGTGPNWIFDLDFLTNSMIYKFSVS
ncbi:hypothetical protein Tco_1283268 [Tanacetum coccineum]